MKIIIREQQLKNLLFLIKEEKTIEQTVEEVKTNLSDAVKSGGLSKEKYGEMEYKKNVVSLQIALTLLDYELPIWGVDGLYGPETGRAVYEFIKDNFEENERPKTKYDATPEVLEKVAEKLEAENLDDTDSKKIEKFTQSPEFVKKEVKSDMELPKRFLQVPAGDNVWRSSQPTEEQLIHIIQKYGIEDVIRFNGNTVADSGGMTQNEERKTCESTYTTTSDGTQKKCKFHQLDANRDQDKVNELLSKGNVLIHCRAGKDRTGGNVGGWLHSIGWGDTNKIWKYTTDINDWIYLIKNKPKEFVDDGYLAQAKKFGVRDLDHAKKLAD